MACNASNLSNVRYLLQNGAEINAITDDGITPLHESLFHRQTETATVQLLLEKGAEVNTYIKSLETTPLMEAASLDKLLVAELLLKAGALPNAKSSKGLTPICYAISSCENELAHLFLAHGAEVHSTCLHLAAERGRIELAKLFLEKGLNINALDEVGRTPLHYAIRSQEWEIARLFLEKGADAAVRDNEGRTPLDLIKNSRELYNDIIFNAFSFKHD